MIKKLSSKSYKPKGSHIKENIDMTPFNYILLDRNDNSCLQQTDR